MVLPIREKPRCPRLAREPQQVIRIVRSFETNFIIIQHHQDELEPPLRSLTAAESTNPQLSKRRTYSEEPSLAFPFTIAQRHDW